MTSIRDRMLAKLSRKLVKKDLSQKDREALLAEKRRLEKGA